jgi:predicted nuclease of predicted toxin-antitoxin system
VRLLFDENLARRLAGVLSDLYPGSFHIADCGLRGASDAEIWQYAKDNGLVIVSKDSDFSQRSSLFGSPPKVIWLRIGNCTTTRADFILRNSAQRMRAFFSNAEESCLVLSHPRVGGSPRSGSSDLG